MSNPPSDTPRRILIVRLSALGDIIHGLTLLTALRQCLPDATIGWLCEPAGAQLLEGHPLLDRLHVAPRRNWKLKRWRAFGTAFASLRRELKGAAYDVSIDLQGLSKSAMWPWLVGIPRRIGYAGGRSRELSSFFNNRRVPSPRGPCHVIQCGLELMLGLGLRPPVGDQVRTHVYLPDVDRQRAGEILAGRDSRAVPPLVVMSLGAGWLTKIWAPAKYAELAVRLVEERHACVVLAWGPGEEYLISECLDHVRWNESSGPGKDAIGSDRAFIRSTVPCRPGIHVMPASRFMELSAVISRANLFVGGDTGPTHMAAALRVPTVSMMGPLDARVNGPLGEHCTTIQHAIPSRPPRGVNHRKWCDPQTDLEHVTVNEVYSACLAFLHR